MKDSGIEWIGEIPETWEIVPIFYCANVVNDKNQKLVEKHTLKFTYGEIVDKVTYNEETTDDILETIRNYTIVKKNDIMINGLNLAFDFVTQRVGKVNTPGAITSAYMAIRTNDRTTPRYLTYLFKTYDNLKAFHNMGGGVRKILNYKELSKQKILLPPKSEQQQIADFLDHKTAEIDGLIDKINTEIDTLKQYQSSVITQAVTKGLDPNVPMKDSGIEWIGEIPETWKMVKIKHLVNTVNLKDKLSNLNSRYIGLENVEKGTGKLIMTATTYPDEIYKICKKGNVLYSKLRPNLAKVLIAPFDSCCTSEFEVLNTFNNRWIKYCLLSNGITEMTTAATYGVKMPRVNWEEVSNYKIPVPKNDEIEFINNYIDSKMLTVDNLIKQKQQQINQLTEYKNSLIFEYVTGKKQVKEAN